MGFNELRQMLLSLQGESFFSRMHTMRETIDLIKQRVERGLRIFNSIKELSQFLNETGINEITNEFVSSKFESLYTRLYKMRDSLKEDFDELQEHDRRKSGLKSVQKQLLDSCNTILISESGWNEILKQEFYRYWIDYLERRHEELRGNPFETYLNNRNQLANLIEEHRKIVIQRIVHQTSGSIIRPSTALSTNRAYKLHYNPWSALLGELTKKRHIMSIRKLIEKYESIILKVAPCWLAT